MTTTASHSPLRSTHPLSMEQVAFYEKNGFLIGDVLFDEKDLVEIREHMALVFAGWYETGVPPSKIDWRPGEQESKLKKVDNGWWADMVIRRVTTDSRIAAAAAQLSLSGTIRLFQDQLIHKPGIGPDAPRSAAIGWHQDYAYWRCTSPASLLTARVALDNETIQNGCMRVIPGSHRWALQSTKLFFKPDSDLNDLPEFDIPHGTATEVVPCLLRPGQVMFHHCMTLHGSSENRTDSPRRSFSIHLMPADTCYRAGTGDHPWNVALLHGYCRGEARDGDLWQGDRFPVLFPVSGKG